MTALWMWESSAPAAAGSGVHADEEQAKRAASAWMLANGADSGTVEQVRLALGAGNLATRHQPTGVMLRASRGPGGRVRWEAARRTA